jgi:Na+/H+ antiporter NhaD/arsenite permease-like protein
LVSTAGLLVLALLALLVALIAWGRIERHIVSSAIALALIVLGLVRPLEALGYVDWDVLGLILGMSIMTIYIEQSGLADLVASRIAGRGRGVGFIVFSASMISGAISIFLENVTVVLILAPIAFKLAEILGINPALILIPIALASNMSGSATMVGDPPAILTAGYFGLDFMDFIWYDGKPSMFFMTIVPMLVACSLVSYLVSRSVGRRAVAVQRVSFRASRSAITEVVVFLAIKIVLLSFRHELHLSLSLIALISVGGLTLTRLIVHRDVEGVRDALVRGFEWKLLVFLVGVFILSGAFHKHGLADATADLILQLSRGDLFTVTSLLVLLSVIASAFIDNVPYVVTMLPVVEAIALQANVDPVIVAWSMLLGATLGGNLTYIGASANVTAVRMLERNGYQLSFIEFIKMSFPFNTASVVTGWLMYEVIWILPLYS